MMRRKVLLAGIFALALSALAVAQGIITPIPNILTLLTVGMIAVQDVIKIQPATNATPFTGTITPIDFLEDRTFQLPDSGGIVLVSGDNFHRPHYVAGISLGTGALTSKALLDGSINVIFGSPIGIITYREEQTKTVSSWDDITGELSIIGDGATSDDEGVEIFLGAPAGASGWITTGATGSHGGGCFEIHSTVALIAGTDQFIMGWRNVTAFVTDNVYTGYADYSAVGLNNVDGSIFSLGGKAGTDTTDDSGVNLANGNALDLEVCIAGTTGIPSAFYKIGAGAWTAITMTNTGAARTAAVQMAPFISYMHTGTTVDPGILISNLYITR